MRMRLSRMGTPFGICISLWGPNTHVHFPCVGRCATHANPYAGCRYAAYVLANLAANADLSVRLGADGAAGPLVELCRSFDPNTKCLATSALRRLAELPDNRPRIVAAGGLQPIAVAGMSDALETQREAAALLNSLSLVDANKLPIADGPGLAALVKLCQSKDAEVARQAVGALANVAEDLATHGVIAKHGGGTFMVGLMHHTSLDVHREASRAVANLLSSFDSHSEVVQDGLPGLAHLAVSADAECQYNAALAFRKLAPNLASHRGIVDGGCLQALFFLLKVRDPKVRRQAAIAIRDVVANPDHKERFVAEGGLDFLMALIREPSVELQCLGMASLRHVSLDDSLKRTLVDAGVLVGLQKSAVTKNQDLQVCRYACPNAGAMPVRMRGRPCDSCLPVPTCLFGLGAVFAGCTVAS